MAKNEDGAQPAVDWKPKDWFVSAITCEGTVRDCLHTVVVELQRKNDFIKAIEQRLCITDLANTDRLTHLGKEVKELENTLRFRLGLLRPDHEAAWFRKAGRKDFGPFRSSMLMEPVFAPYRNSDIDQVKKAIKLCWEKSSLGPLPFLDTSPCLWRILLDKKHTMNEMAILAAPYQDLRLDELPDGLPDDLESRSLRAFLINVRSEFAGVRERLNICFDQLWNTSEKFWQAQLAEEKVKREPKHTHKETKKEKTHEVPPEDENSFSEREMRDSFSRMEALRFMGFRQAPNKETLRKRYLEMAKNLHPDRGGSADSFKRLSRAYEELSK